MKPWRRGDDAPPEWRGVAAEDNDDVPGTLSALLRSRSRRLLGSLLRPHRRRIALAAAFLVAQATAALAGPYLVMVAIDRGIPPLLGKPANSGPLVVTVLLLAVAAIARSLATRGFIRQSGRAAQDVLFDLRTRVFDHFQGLSMAFHEKYTSGRVISRLTSDVEAIAELLDLGLQTLLTSTLAILSTMAILFVLDVPLALVSLAVIPLLVALTIWFRRHSARSYREGRISVALVIVHFVESLGGIRAVHAFRREDRNQEIFVDVDDRYRRANTMSMQLAGIYGPTTRFLGVVALVVVLLVGGLRAIDGAVTVGVLAAFVLYLRRVFEPMQELSQFYNLLQAATAALEKLSGVLEERSSVAAPVAAVSPPVRLGEVVFEDVHFSYRTEREGGEATGGSGGSWAAEGRPDPPINRKEPARRGHEHEPKKFEVLHGIDLRIPAGQTLALVGETGAGKSTIARLLARFYDPTAGRILLDGVDLRDLSDADLRRSVAMVTQENFLFSGTIAENIAFGRPTATHDEIVAAAEALGADGFIRNLPDGYDTDVKKRGGRLSAGQRQLVAFARAFLADPSVLILDEATSSLDIPSERLVQRALRTLLADRTAVIIAHRLTTVEVAERVVVIDNGTIVEDGAPADLVTGSAAEESRYASLHRAWRDSLV